MFAVRQASHISDALDRLAGALESVDFGPGTAQLAAERDRLAATVRSYLLPRSDDPSTPLTVVFAGPTGSGKSTLINTLTRLELSRAGVLRPTTTGPVVLTSPSRAGDYETMGGIPCEVATGQAPILETMVLVDTPDIDSKATEHRTQAETLVDHADVVVFVTSALRYADAVPWQLLRRALARGTDVINVLNRVGSATSGAIVDFRSRLGEAGLDGQLITVPEHHVADGAQTVPPLAVRSLARRLAVLAADRDGSAGETFHRVLTSTLSQVSALAEAIEELNEDLEDLEAELSIDLADRAGRLSLSGAGEGLYPAPPSVDGRQALRRWRRSGRRHGLTTADMEKALADRIAAAVHGDIRSWLSGQRGIDRRSISPDLVISVTVPATRSAVRGWVDSVRGIADEHGSPDTTMAIAALFDAATSERRCEAVGLLWGDQGEALAERARRELTDRLEIVYQQAGSRVVELLERERGSLDGTGLRAAVGAVTAAIAPVDA